MYEHSLIWLQKHFEYPRADVKCRNRL